MYLLRSLPAENPQTAVAVAAENVRLSITDKGLDAPEIVAVGVEVAADLDELALLASSFALDLERAQPAGVVRQVGMTRALRIGRYLMH